MNEDDRKAFEKWTVDGLPTFRCTCKMCNNDREKSWQAALEYERSSPERQTIKHTIEQLRAENDSLSYEMASLKAENIQLLAENKRLADACEACENMEKSRAEIEQLTAIIDGYEKYHILKRMDVGDTRPEFAIYSTQRGIDWITHLCESERVLKQRIASLEARQSKSTAQPERIFTPCPEHSLVTQMRANETGEQWTHCPWCGTPLWRERKVVTIEREVLLRRSGNSADGWLISVIAPYANGKLDCSDTYIRAKAIITFEAEES